MIRRGGLWGWLMLLVLIGVTPFLGLRAYTIYQIWLERQANAEAFALHGVRFQAEKIDTLVLEVGRTLGTIGALSSPDPADTAANDAFLQELKKTLPDYYSGLALVDPQGRNIGFGVREEATEPRPGIADRAYFQTALRSNDVVVGDPVISRSTGRTVLPIARAISDPNGEVRMVALAALELHRLQDLLNPGQLPAQSVITLITSDGIVLARSLDPATWIGQDISAVPSVQDVLQQREGVSVHTAADGVERVAAFAPLQEAPWVVYVGIPEAIVFQPVRNALLRDNLLGLVSLLLTLLITTIMARRISRPLTQLADDATAFGAGDLHRRSTVQVGAEIGVLAHSFNRMADALEQQFQQLQASRAEVRRLAEVVERAHDSIVISTTDGVVQYTNPAATALYAVQPGMLFKPDSTQQQARSLQSSTFGAETTTITILQSDGTTSHIELSRFPLPDADGQPAAVASIGRDITERMRLEAQLRHAQKLESVGRLAGGIAHDFNNLLTVISGYAELALDMNPTHNPQRAELEAIHKATLQAQRLTRQLLAFARKQPVQEQILDLGLLINGMDTLLRRLLGETIRLVIATEAKPFLIKGDPGQIEQVLVNLTTNARDAMPEGGTVTISLAVVDIDSGDLPLDPPLAPATYVRLIVADTGSGIDANIRNQLFEPFFTTKPKGQGTGLGLAICYGIISQHGGTILVESALGSGTEMHVLLPLATGGVDPIEDTQNLPLPRGSETVLIVEDIPAVRDMVVRVLRQQGYTTLEAANGVEALAYLHTHHAATHLVISDVVMPDLGGIELAEQMRARYPATRLLLMSGYIDEIDQSAQLEPPVPILHKPFAPHRLLRIVRALLDAEPPPSNNLERS